MKKWRTLLLVFLLGLWLVSLWPFTSIHVTGRSMEPTIPHDTYVLAVKGQRARRFDVVTFIAPDEAEETKYIKRVIGLPGETIEFKDSTLYILGQAVTEEYLRTPSGKIYTPDFDLYEELGQITVPASYLFVLGDNRPVSNDSRQFGFIKKEAVECHATLIYWPPQHMGIIQSQRANNQPQYDASTLTAHFY
ncbi:signal peptidase I [Enterococcus nangangensis]|uniref:signal peptidase I n=1 Tax=Enterococcus nangangensis TaxID=2559926 RepID=UPI0014852ACC|nr:signal peptidase I [Enterococcus nangangensis]